MALCNSSRRKKLPFSKSSRKSTVMIPTLWPYKSYRSGNPMDMDLDMDMDGWMWLWLLWLLLLLLMMWWWWWGWDTMLMIYDDVWLWLCVFLLFTEFIIWDSIFEWFCRNYYRMVCLVVVQQGKPACYWLSFRFSRCWFRRFAWIFVTPMNKTLMIMFVQLGEVTIDAVVDCTPISFHVRYIY